MVFKFGMQIFRLNKAIKYSYSYYIYSGDEGTFEIFGVAGATLFEEERPIMEKISTSFRFGSSLKNAMKSPLQHPTPSPTSTPSPEKPCTIPSTVLPKAA